MVEWLKHYLDLSVFGLLGFMSLLTVWAVLERLIFFSRVDLRRFDHEDRVEVSLTRNLSLIATVASNAPFVGLLGTVLGVLVTFHDLGTHGQIEASAIMLGLALALKATAAGIAVALPASIAYNALLRQAYVRQAEWRALRDTGGLVASDSSAGIR